MCSEANIVSHGGNGENLQSVSSTVKVQGYISKGLQSDKKVFAFLLIKKKIFVIPLKIEIYKFTWPFWKKKKKKKNEAEISF